MSKLPPRIASLAKSLGVPLPEEIVEFLQESASDAADTAVDGLNATILAIVTDSRSKVLNGYYAKKVALGKTPIVLRKSGIDLSGYYDWHIFVKATGDHSAANTNVFDRINEGRPALPYRTKPYALFAAALRLSPNSNIRRSNVPFPSNARLKSSGPNFGGNYPLGQDRVSISRRARGDIRGKGQPMVFSRGPLAAIPARNLYTRTLTLIKRQLAKKNSTYFFTTAIVQREDFGISE